MKNLELYSLIKRVKNDENKAFEELYGELWSIVYYLAFYHLGDSELAKDVTQETFVIIYQKIGDLKSEVAFNRWMNRIVINLCYKHQNMSIKESYMDIDELTDDFVEEKVEFLPEQLLYDKSKRTEILNDISALSLKHRTVILLYYFEEMTLVDIAKTLGISKSAVHKRLISAQQKLRLTLHQDNIPIKQGEHDDSLKDINEANCGDTNQ